MISTWINSILHKYYRKSWFINQFLLLLRLFFFLTTEHLSIIVSLIQKFRWWLWCKVNVEWQTEKGDGAWGASLQRVSSNVLGDRCPRGQAVGSKHSVLVSPPGEGLGLGGSRPLREWKEVGTVPWAGVPSPGRTQLIGKCRRQRSWKTPVSHLPLLITHVRPKCGSSWSHPCLSHPIGFPLSLSDSKPSLSL